MIRFILDKAVEGILCLLLLASPLLLASNRPLPLFLVQTLIFTGLLCWILTAVFFERALTWIKTPVNVVLGLLVLLGILQLLLPAHDPSWASGSWYGNATVESLWKGLSYILLFWLILNFAEGEHELSSLIQGMFLTAFVTSLIGVLQRLSGTPKVLWFYEIVINDRPFPNFFSTFTNANHFATFTGMIVLLLLGRFLYLHSRRRPRACPGAQPQYSPGVQAPGEWPSDTNGCDRKHRARSLDVRPSLMKRRVKGGEKMALLYTLALSCVSLFLSLSRGGSIFFALSLLGLSLWALLERRQNKSAVPIAVFVFLTVAMLLWIGIGPVISELKTVAETTHDVSFQQRIALWRSSLVQIFPKFPLLGTGLGTFQYVFPGFKPFGLYGFWQHAHSDWVEWAVESGMVGMALILILLILFFAEIRTLLAEPSDPYIRYVGTGTVTSVLFLLLMSLYDFPLRTTACAVYFSSMAAIAIKLRHLQDKARGINRTRSLTLRSPFSRGMVCLLGLIFFVFSLSGVARPYLAHRQVEIGGKDSIPSLESAIHLDPKNADYHFWLGLALGREAVYKGYRRYNHAKMRLAVKSIEKAIALNPRCARYDYGLVMLSQMVEDREATEVHFQRTLAKEPRNPYFQIYYSIFCFNEAVVDSLVYGKDISKLPFFEKAFKAYFKAKEVLPRISLAQYRQWLAGYEFLNRVAHAKGYLGPNALL